MGTPAELIRYLETLRLSGGDLDGQRFTVWPWQRRYLRGTFSRAGDSALTVGRGNGKSGLVAGIACAVVDPEGPLHSRRGEVVVVASSFEQGRNTIFEDVLHYLADAGYDLESRKVWRKADSGNLAKLEYKPSGARVRVIGSDPRRAHGLRAKLILADEPAQWPQATSDRMLAALRTGMGKTPGSRLIALGTRPSSETHWFSRLLQTAAYSQVHAAGPDDPPMLMKTIRRANPSIDYLPSLRARILSDREDARHDPDALQAYKALRLNMGVSDTERSVLLDAGAWARAEGMEPREREGRYVLGLDLGSSLAMSAAVAYWPSGALDALAVFPREPSLQARGLADGVGNLYQNMADRGELMVAGQHVSDIKALLSECLARWGRPAALVCDRWRADVLREEMGAMSFPQCALEVRGQGFKDGGEDVWLFRRAVLDGKVRPEESLLLTSALREARVVVDPAGNSKLAKATEGGRRRRAKDDAASAAIMAVAAGARAWHTKTSRRRGAYLGVA